MKSLIDKNHLKVKFQRVRLAVVTLVKWLLCACLSGLSIGLVGALFHHLLGAAAQFCAEYSWMIFLLPLAGVLIVFIYQLSGSADNKGTNLVITAIQSNEEVPTRVAPLIIISTILTHICGGSAGREGAALQVGGSLGGFFAKLLHFDDKDTRIMIMCGMSACFSALFGTPIAAAVFSMEVISVGIMYYAALVPCVVSALIADGVSTLLGIGGPSYPVGILPDMSALTGGKMAVMSILFALASIFLCTALHKIAHFFTEYFQNAYFRIIAAGILVVALRYVFQSVDYLGAGTTVIAKSFITSCAWYVFLLKILFTAITLGGGFKGGEIVPTLFAGATLGSFLAPLFGLPTGLCAACGMVSVFCGVTNCPLTSLILAVEMFGSGSLKYCMLCIAMSYLLSGYYSLYNSQKIMYSKYRTEYINRKPAE